jgi:hypothetical protein
MADRLTLLEKQQRLLDEATLQMQEHDVLLGRALWGARILTGITLAYVFGLIPGGALVTAIGIGCFFAGYWIWRTRQFVKYMQAHWKAQARLMKINS